MKNFLTSFGDFLHATFRLCFGIYEVEFEKAKNVDEASWHIISSPLILENGTISIFPYENKLVKSAVLSIKRRNDSETADVLGAIAADFLSEELAEMALMENFSNPIIIGVPLSKKSMSEKGFNHTDIIAMAIAKHLPILKHLSPVLIKTRHTEPQKNLPRARRLINIKHSMAVKKNQIEKVTNRCLIIVDDVSTTGATLAEAKRALLEAGARKVLCLALAH